MLITTFVFTELSRFCACVCVQVITEIQELVTPEKCNIMVVSKLFSDQCKKKEEWFGTHFSREGIAH